MSNQTAILKAFELGMKLAPGVNASDLWHHIVYRHYLRTISVALPRIADGGQSWKRASGDGFQIFVQDYYNPRLAKHGISLRSLSADEQATLSRLGLLGAFRPAKIDLVAERPSEDNWRPLSQSECR